MIRWILQRAARRFGRRYQYDVSYMLDTIEASPKAGVRALLYSAAVGYPGPPAAGEVVLGASLASILDGDCGPCTQLVIDMGLEAGASPERLRACVQGQQDLAGDIGLGHDFARAIIAGTPNAEGLAQEITRLYGRQALVAASFAAASTRFYPVFKRGLGHGATCTRVRIGELEAMVVNAAK